MVFFSAISTLFVLTFLYKALSTLVQKKLRKILTALDEIPLLSLPRSDDHKLRGTVVICGGSIAGLLSARVCSDHFDKVVIVEPEEWVATPDGLHDRHRQWASSDLSSQKRSRVPQYTSLHAYQPFTTLALRKMFSNFDLELQRAGARCLTSDVKAHWSGIPIVAPVHQYSNDAFPTVMVQTRAGYETTLRRLVLTTCPNVEYITGTVTAIVPHESKSNIISSVSIRSGMGEEISVSSTLVVDCTGPALGGLRWLQGFLSARNAQTKAEKTSILDTLKTTYNPKMAYTTCEFDVSPRLFVPLKALGFPEDYETAGYQYVNFPDPHQDKRNLIVTRREHNFLQIACGGWDVSEHMTSIGDIKSFLLQMVCEHPIPEWIQRMLDLFEDEQVPATYVHVRAPPSVYVQYHRAEMLPSNFIAIGDSVLQLNPIRGQGCTKACVEAVTLNALLYQCGSSPEGRHDSGDSLPEGFGRTFFSVQARRTGSLWNTYKSEDYAWKSTIPAKGDNLQSSGSWKRSFGSSFTRLMLKDPEVSAVWWHAVNWLAPATDLFSPTILIKIAGMRLQRSLGM